MLGTSSKNVGHFSKNLGRFSKNVGDFPKNVGLFPKNVGVFFQSLPREDFSQQIGTQKKAGNGRAASIEVQPLIARIDNFQTWTHNYIIKRARRKLLRCGAGKVIIAAKRSRYTCEIGMFTLEQT